MTRGAQSAVADLLAAAGEVDEIVTVTSLGGRNRVEKIRVASGEEFVVSTWGALTGDASERLRRVTRAHDGRFGSCVHFRLATLRAVDSKTHTALHDFVTPDPAPPNFASVCRAFAELHSRGLSGDEELSRPALPDVAPWEGLEPAAWQALSSGELEAWALIQSIDLREAIMATLAPAPRVPVHGDARRANVFGDDHQRITIVDWEDYHAGDAARDLGFLFGDVVERELRAGLARVRSSQGAIAMTTAAEQALGAAAGTCKTGWDAYVETRRPDDPQLAERSVRFAGWRMAETALAEGAVRLRLTGDTRAVLGVGLTMMSQPDAFIGLIASPVKVAFR